MAQGNAGNLHGAFKVRVIDAGLALRLVFHRPLRQTEGTLRSIAECSRSILPFLIIPP